MNRLHKILVAIVTIGLVQSVYCKAGVQYMRRSANNVPQQNFPEYWYHQVLDHFNPEDSRTFRQRYYVNDNYYSVGGPIFLYINGEGPVQAPPNLNTDEVVLLAQKFNAMIVTLEHRYYGKSQPFTSWTTENLKFLSSKQAIFDLAHFVVYFRDSLHHKYNVTDTKIFNIGCSYSGALSAWFRLKFPHITVGAISSSGVVNAILEFTAFDTQVATSAGSECTNVLQKITQLLEQKVLHSTPSVKAEILAKFNAQTLTDDGDFFYMVADAMATSVQYGYQDDLCNPLINSYTVNGTSQLIEVFADYVTNYWTNTIQLGDPREYATTWQQDVTVDDNKADRQWWFQTCTELGYFQTAPKENSIRSHIVNITYFKNHCKNVFEMDLWPDTSATNEYYGGNKVAATKVFFANGSQGHCVDVRTCPGGCDNPNDLQPTRDLIEKYVANWLL